MFIAAKQTTNLHYEVYSVNKVLYPLKFIQKTDIKKGVHSERLILFFNFGTLISPLFYQSLLQIHQ